MLTSTRSSTCICYVRGDAQICSFGPARPDWKDFKKRVLEPAVKQINDDPLGAGFSVEYEPVRKGRFYNEIVFHLTKTPKRIQSDKLIRLASGDAKTIRAAKKKGRPALLPKDIERVAQNTSYYFDMAEMERQFWAHWESTGKPDFAKGVAVAFKGFVDKKYRKEKGRR